MKAKKFERDDADLHGDAQMITPTEFLNLPGPTEDEKLFEERVDAAIRQTAANGRAVIYASMTGFSRACVAAVSRRYQEVGWRAEVVYGSDGHNLVMHPPAAAFVGPANTPPVQP